MLMKILKIKKFVNKQSVHLNKNIFVSLKRNKKKCITYTNFNKNTILNIVYFKIIGIKKKIKLHFYKIKEIGKSRRIKQKNCNMCQKIMTFTSLLKI